MEEINRKVVWTYGAIVAITIIGLSLVNIFNIRYPISVTTSPVSSELAVVGEGKIDVAPDTAYVDAGVAITGVPTVAEVEKRINEINNKVIQAMQVLGIKKADIKTTNYSIYPNSVFESGRQKTSGYNGNVTITIKVEKIDMVAKVITEATAAGANQVQGARFEVGKPEIYREKAREAAIKNAREQAQKLAKTLGIRLGRVTNIVEMSPDVAIPILQTARMEAIGGGVPAPDIAPGTQTISSTVTLYFEKY